jgi:hypothetical protein
MSSIRRWAPFTLITIGYVVILRIAVYSVYYLYKIYTISPHFGPDFKVSPDDYGLVDILLVIFMKLWSCLPEQVSFGPSVMSEIVGVAVGALYGLSLGAICYFTWVFSTRVQIVLGKYKTENNVWWNGKIARRIMFLTVLAAPLLQFWVYAALPIYHHIVPSLNDSVRSFDHTDAVYKEIYNTHVKDLRLLDLLILSLPGWAVCGLVVWIFKKWKEYPELKERFYDWKYRSKATGGFFQHQNAEPLPDIVVGVDFHTGEPIVQPGGDRNLNNLIAGSIGTGKTSARIIPEANQDLNHMVDMINHVDEDTPEDQSRRLNGLTVIEPSNDLCKKVYTLAKAHGIPEEAIYYLDPTNPETRGINPLRGPIEKAVETFVMVIQSLAANSDEFFKQSQRSHLKHYVYLLKLAKGNDATFDELMQMYSDMYLVVELLESVEKRIPQGWQQIENRDERNHWYIVDGICKWFRERGIEVPTDRNGAALRYETGPNRGKVIILDKQADFVQGLRNILDDIASSKIIRRVLFGNSDFDVDTHLKAGGILLVNTAKGELSELSSTLGRFIILMMHNGVFRRDSNSRDPYHHIIVDEFPDYFYENFTTLPAQSRKYKSIISIACQSLAQLSKDFGDDTMYVVMSTMRHKMCYADIDPKTARVFSEYFGEEYVYESSDSEQMTSALSNSPGRREGVSVKKTVKVRLSPSDLIHLKPFVGALKLVEENDSSQPVRLVRANFVPQSEFEKAKKQVDPEKGSRWLAYREEYAARFNDQLLRDMGILDEAKHNPIDAYPAKEYERVIGQAVLDPDGQIGPLDRKMVQTMYEGKASDKVTQGQPATITEHTQEVIVTPIPQTTTTMPFPSQQKAVESIREEKEKPSQQDAFGAFDPMEAIMQQMESFGLEDIEESPESKPTVVEQEQPSIHNLSDPGVEQESEWTDLLALPMNLGDEEESFYDEGQLQQDLSALIKKKGVQIEAGKQENKKPTVSLNEDELFEALKSGK